jgi:hypothetical protein
VFDVYVDQSHRVFLVDFNPFSPTTDFLLFSYEEDFKELAESFDADEEITPGQEFGTDGDFSRQFYQDHNNFDFFSPADYEFLFIDSPLSIRPSETMMYRLPKDYLDLSGKLKPIV